MLVRPVCELATEGSSGLSGSIDTAFLSGLVDAIVEIEKPVRLVGHSLGGQWAIRILESVPDRVSAITLLCSRDTPFPAFLPAAQRLRDGDPVDVDGAMARWFTAQELSAPSPGSGATDAAPDVVGYARRCLSTVDTASYIRDLESIARFDRSDVLAETDAAVTLIAAELDAVSTPEAMAQIGERAGVPVTVLSGARHMSPFTDPEALAALLTGEARVGQEG